MIVETKEKEVAAMKIGYIRVSTDRQVYDRQVDALEREDCDRIIEEKFSGKTRNREGLQKLFDIIREGDVVVVESISRIGRNAREIVDIVEELEEKGVEFRSLKEQVDTSTAMGRAMFQIIAALAQLEREQTVERVREGLESAKRRGKKLGRPRADKRKMLEVIRLYEKGGHSVAEVCELTNTKRATFLKYLKIYRENQERAEV